MAAAIAAGEKLPMFVIGKAKNGQCIIGRVGEKNKWGIEAKERKVALIIDNCPVHPEIENLSHVKLIFLPPNTTSVIQPMDQGVIRSLIAHYRKRLVRAILTLSIKKSLFPKFCC